MPDFQPSFLSVPEAQFFPDIKKTREFLTAALRIWYK
jgi:hypothetical protein